MIRIINADVIKGLKTLPDNSVHCVITSPPYYRLRDYGIEGQIGLEDSPEEYINRLVEVFNEVKRVLRNDGTFWLNIGDSYASNGIYIGKYIDKHPDKQNLHTSNHERYPQKLKGFRGGKYNIKAKDLMGIPWRLAFALQEDGWYLRSDIIWAKPNPMPESVSDRPVRSHEYVFLLTKSAKYFYDADAVREPHKYPWEGNGRIIKKEYNGTVLTHGAARKKGGFNEYIKQHGRWYNPIGHNLRDVWAITTQPYPEAHFATFPKKLVEPCIKAGTSEYGCCSKCGTPYNRIVEKGKPLEEWKKECGADSSGGYSGQSKKWLKQDAVGKNTYTGFNNRWKIQQQNASDVKRRILEGMRERISRWEQGCKCNAGVTPCVVLDPFAGSGTVGEVARELGRDAILIELNPEYVKLMKKRLRANEQLINDVQVEVL